MVSSPQYLDQWSQDLDLLKYDDFNADKHLALEEFYRAFRECRFNLYLILLFSFPDALYNMACRLYPKYKLFHKKTCYNRENLRFWLFQYIDESRQLCI